MTKADDLRAQLAAEEEEEKFAKVKAKWLAGEISRSKYEKAQKAVVRARLGVRLSEDRPGSQKYRLEDDGKIVALKTRTRHVKVRYPEDHERAGDIDEEASYLETYDTEEVL